MKLLSSGVIALVLLPLSMAAHAANLPLPTKAAPPPPSPYPLTATSDWTGFYLGINGGIANEQGVLVGGTLGYNYQISQLVLGVEGDLDATWANVAAPTLGTVRGRIGIALGQFMPYLTAGWADGDHDSSGSAYGGGIEFRMIQALSMKVEYLHVELYRPDDIVRVGLNWHFNSTGFFTAPLSTRD
jgi:outer membrane immunogenic protein